MAIVLVATCNLDDVTYELAARRVAWSRKELAMQWEVIGAISQVFGGVAVLVTLVFLARQLHQTNKLGIAEAEREWFAAWHDNVRATMGSVEAASVMRNGLNRYSALDPNEQAVFSTNMLCLFDYADVLRRLNEKGFVDDGILQPVIKNLMGILGTPGGTDWWNQVGPALTIYEYVEAQSREGVPPLSEAFNYFNEDSLKRLEAEDC